MTIETTKPPIGIAVCRMPSASPRCVAGNQDMTARPLAECTLAPARPVAKRQAKSAQKLCACGREQERAAARADPDDQHHPLAEPVGRQPPRHERQDRAERATPR